MSERGRGLAAAFPRLERLVRWVRPKAVRSEPGGGHAALESFFGPLELRVLEVLWRRPAEASVRELQDDFPGIAYTTLMTTLDRLYKKGVLDRSRHARAYRYTPRMNRAALEGALASEALDAIVRSFSSADALRPLLTSFVEAVSQRDRLCLDELEDLLARRRREAGVTSVAQARSRRRR